MSETGQRQLPSNWTWTRLGEIADINPRMNYSNLDPKLPVTFVPMADVEEHSGTIVSPQLTSLEEARKGHTKFQENDVIFARITPCMENGKTAIARNLKKWIGIWINRISRPSTQIRNSARICLRFRKTRVLSQLRIKTYDQHGRSIKGSTKGSRRCIFSVGPNRGAEANSGQNQ